MAVAESIDRIVVPGVMPAPDTCCPIAKPTVEERLVTAALPVVVTPVTPLVNIRAWKPAAVAAAERVTVLRLASIAKIVVLADMPTPVTDIPTERREVSDR